VIVESPLDIDKIVEVVATIVADRTISIPQIVVLPKRQINFYFSDFDLNGLDTINVRPVDDGLVIQTIRTEVRQYLAKSVDDPREERSEDYLVRYLIERNEVDYDAHADLLYKLSGQMVSRIRSYLETDAEVESALLRHGRQLAEFIFSHMMQHYHETLPVSMCAHSSRRFRLCRRRAAPCSAASPSAALPSRSLTPIQNGASLFSLTMNAL
jgi:type III restriction enzyme